MNNRYVTYLVVPHINDRLSINGEAFDIVICDRICENVHSSHKEKFWLFCSKTFRVMRTYCLVSFSTIQVLITELLAKTCSIHYKINFM